MKCGSCGSENFPEGRFCEQCGAPLEAHCPECGAGVRLTARYCGSCGCRLPTADGARSLAAASAGAAKPTRGSNEGVAPSLHTPSRLAEKILAGRSAIDGERRQVTVLFGDIVGFTAMAEKLDPEEVSEIIARGFELVTAEIHRFEGTIIEYGGDG